MKHALKPRHYFLFFIFAIYTLLFIVFRYNPHYQRDVVYATSGSYFLWSLYHHYRQGDLHLSIIIEYLSFIVLALIVLGWTLSW